MDMKVNVEELSNYERKLTVSIPNSVVDEQANKSVLELKKSADVKGFRKGKIPLTLVKSLFKKDVEKMIETNLLKEYLPKILDDEKLEPISIPTIISQEIDSDRNFIFSASFEIKPDINLGTYDDIPVTLEEISINDEEIDKEIKRLQEVRSILCEIKENRPTTDGDFIHLELTATLADKKLDKYSDDEKVIELGKGYFLPGIDIQLIGMVKDEEKSFDLAIPATYFDQTIAAKTISVKAKVTMIKVKETPHLDDEFAKSLGEFETFSELKEKIKNIMFSKKEELSEKKAGDNIIGELLKRHAFGIPKSLIDFQIKQMIKETMMQYRFHGFNREPSAEDIRKLESEYHDQAVTSVKSMLLLETIAEREKIEIKDEDIDDHLEKLLNENPQLRKEIVAYYTREENKETLKHQLTIDKTLKFLIDKNTNTPTTNGLKAES